MILQGNSNATCTSMLYLWFRGYRYGPSRYTYFHWSPSWKKRVICRLAGILFGIWTLFNLVKPSESPAEVHTHTHTCYKVVHNPYRGLFTMGRTELEWQKPSERMVFISGQHPAALYGMCSSWYSLIYVLFLRLVAYVNCKTGLCSTYQWDPKNILGKKFKLAQVFGW